MKNLLLCALLLLAACTTLDNDVRVPLYPKYHGWRVIDAESGTLKYNEYRHCFILQRGDSVVRVYTYEYYAKYVYVGCVLDSNMSKIDEMKPLK